MELNWTTFLLEILNFLVLLWLLKRFFYKPLQNAIARRQSAIQQQLDDARKMKKEAQRLQQSYENDLAALEQGREEAHAKLQRELNMEREKQEKHLTELLQQKRQKAHVIEQRQLRESHRQQEKQALEQGSRFAASLLQAGAGPELESRLLEFLLDALHKLPAEQRVSLQQSLAGQHGPVEVSSAFPLSAGQRQRIESGLNELSGHEVQSHFRQDEQLIAGLRIAIGPWVLGANLRDELEAFAHLEEAAPSE
ncbi:F0F1 ATP synthase subunit delta [Microbulbifer mangrovi]|uniref:F0F1 ATP synthase subunit delta n=1 Tax=Microbulbifer mangrovi TaxID=927787 RepID=UPI00130195A9|nr:F0F1 ATP synthase subunit delta [Microbulbifer mangrovi]